MNLVYNNSHKIHKLQWDSSNSITDCNICDLFSLATNLFKKEMVLRSIDFRQTISISINLIINGTICYFGSVPWLWLHFIFFKLLLSNNVYILIIIMFFRNLNKVQILHKNIFNLSG